MKYLSTSLIVSLFGAASATAALAQAAPNKPTKADESLLDQNRIYTVGANGGNAVTIPANIQQSGVITDIYVCGGNWIDAITVTYDNMPAPTIGNVGGDCDAVQGLGSPNAKITGVNVWAGNWIDGIQFQVDGQWGQVFGTQGARLHPFRSANDGGLALIEGRVGAKIDQLKLFFGLPYFITDVVYDEEALRNQIDGPGTPVQAGRVCYVNNTLGQQTATKKWSTTETETKNWNFNTTTEWNVSVEYGFGVEGLGDAGISASAGQSYSTSKGGSSSKEVKLEDSLTMAVDPGQKLQMVFEYRKKPISIPTTYRIAHYDGDRDNIIKLTPARGTAPFSTTQTGTTWTDSNIRHEPVANCDESITQYLGRPEDQVSSSTADAEAPSPNGPAYSWAAIPNGGGFKWAGENTWYELSPTGDRAFTFEVLSQSDSEIRLRDVNRNILIVLDFSRDKVRYASSPQGTVRDLYDIVNKS